MTFSQAFVPAVNKEGLSRLTFLGMTQKSDKSQVKDKNGVLVFNEDGSPKMRPWTMTNLRFEVLGKFKGNNREVTITAGETISEDNLLGKTLAAMGYSTTVETALDDEGFEVEVTDETEDGFSQVEDNGVDDIEAFLESQIGSVFVAKVYKETKGKQAGYWTIDVSTIKPHVKPTK